MTMTMADTVGRIAQIQNTLTQLSRPGTPTTSPASATAFAGTLANAAAPVATEAAASSGAAVVTAGASGSFAASGPSATAGVAAVPRLPGATAGVTGHSVVSGAQKYLGVPYVFGGEDASGMDCSGLVQRVFADLGIEVPRLVSGQAAQGTEVASLTDAKPGDLLVTHGNTHIVIYAGDGKIIHAPRPGKDVRLVDNYLGDADIKTIRRIVPAEATAAAAASAPSAMGAATPPTDVLTAALRSALAGSAS
ncbi:C40 family peptidase [Planctomonas psychrotolerans]|uniref:C40 family peptidase n=1 Tax=Planctomonas psychrotolerans TaxID=2528712 RepID=UPI001D0D3651|nr:C40 family peptidase [Planctomonas psychrotolerans]